MANTSLKPSEVSDILLEQLKDMNSDLQFEEIGKALQVSDGVVPSFEITDEPWGDHWTSVALGRQLAYRVYGEDGYMMALTTADHYYLPISDHPAEYVIVPTDGVNDSAAHAQLLARRARAVGAHVNLIPLNHVEERQFCPSSPGHMKAFIKILEEAGVNVTVRRRLGSDVDASCGQLRRKMQQRSENSARSGNGD